MLSSLNLSFQKESISDPFESSDVKPRSSKRMRTTTSFGEDYYVFLAENDPQTFK